VTPEPNDLICGTCHRPLDVLTDEAGNVKDYWHASGISIGPAHNPVPIPRDEALTESTLVCDFCSTPGGAWRYPARTFDSPDVAAGDHALQRMTEPADLTPRSVGDWMACDVCHADIAAGRWDSIAERACRAQPRFLRTELRRGVKRLHAQFRAHRTGDPIPIRSRR
jgi:hypothetical protein